MHPKFNALFTSVNLLLGVGPLILPMPFFDAGIVLSIIWMVIITFLSYNSARYISQSMSKLNQIAYNNRQSAPGLYDSIVSSQQREGTPQSEALLNENQKLQLDHTDQFQMLYGKKWGLFPCISISIYLLGTSVSKCIMTGKIMSEVFKQIGQDEWYHFFSNFNFWIFVFFVSGAAFSFRSIDKTKIMQIIIIGMRVISIVLFLFGAIYLFCRDGIKTLTPPDKGVFNISDFVSLFSNSVFSLMFHHSFPNIVNNLNTTEDVEFVLRYAFLISGSVLMIIPITGVMAFGKDLGVGSTLKYYNFDFQDSIGFIFWITSFYVFLNIAAFSVYIIVIRTNILHAINPKIDAKKLSKQTAISSLLILTLILLMSWQLQDKIQTVLNFTGGIFGILILFLMPCMEVYKAREIMHRPGDPRNYIRQLPIIIGCLGFAFMGFNLYHIIEKLIHPANS